MWKSNVLGLVSIFWCGGNLVSERAPSAEAAGSKNILSSTRAGAAASMRAGGSMFSPVRGPNSAAAGNAFVSKNSSAKKRKSKKLFGVDEATLTSATPSSMRRTAGGGMGNQENSIDQLITEFEESKKKRIKRSAPLGKKTKALPENNDKTNIFLSDDFEVLDKNLIQDLLTNDSWMNEDDDDLLEEDDLFSEARPFQDNPHVSSYRINESHENFSAQDSFTSAPTSKSEYDNSRSYRVHKPRKQSAQDRQDSFTSAPGSRASRFASPESDSDDDMGSEPESSYSSRQIGTDPESYNHEYGPSSEKGQLYEAYNLLHQLAQDFEKPFDAPAVLVVGHQSSGKSALIEALIGFQYNQVGGGTKTRRPIALKMQYNPQYDTPRCYILDENTGEEVEKSLDEIKYYVESENARLENNGMFKNFDSREIHIRMEYKYCPNMILIDTPGLISAPRSKKANTQHRALIASSQEVEQLVLDKLRCEDYIILCVEDVNDWKHGVTRAIVQKVDVDLSRTVIVNTKLDTKIPQFTNNEDIADFLTASIVDEISPYKLAGPFFTSVPAGRVGRSNNDYFRDNSEFVTACQDVEETDRKQISKRIARLGASVDKHMLINRVGIAKLREYLEHKVDETYRNSVQKIIPLLQSEYATSKQKLDGVNHELNSLSVDNLKFSAYAYADDFTAALRDAIQGSIIAPSQQFGQTLLQEHTLLGSFHDAPNCFMAIPSSTYNAVLQQEVGHLENKLYGGSQYHRVLREFDFATRCLRLPTITQDEIANAAGIGDKHDGVDLLRAACIISLQKAKQSFDPLLKSLNGRLNHVMRHLFDVVDFIVHEKMDVEKSKNAQYFGNFTSLSTLEHNEKVATSGMDITHTPQFKQWFNEIFVNFVKKCSDAAMIRCHDDISALTKYITWDAHDKGGPALLKQALPHDQDAIGVYKVAVESAGVDSDTGKNKKNDRKNKRKQKKEEEKRRKELMQISPSPSDSVSNQQYNILLTLIEQSMQRTNSNQTNTLVSNLVSHIVATWRYTFCKTTVQKFNCYFLMPFLEEFSKYIRYELDRISVDDFYDVSYVRSELLSKRESLTKECTQNERLQERFNGLQNMMRKLESEGMRQREQSSFNRNPMFANDRVRR